MTDIRRADPPARRRALVLVAIAAVVGTLLIIVIDRYRVPLSEWLLADPDAAHPRMTWVVRSLAVLLPMPLLGFALYLWSVGARTLQARMFPPPGLRVVRDIRVIEGAGAEPRGRLLKLLAAVCGAAGLAIGVLLWRLASMPGSPAG